MDASQSSNGPKKPIKKPHPTKEEIALLPDFDGLQLKQIILLEKEEQFSKALAMIQAAGVVGFDTETKPVFEKGVKPDGPHVVQLALNDRAFIIPIGQNPPTEFLVAVLGSKAITKVGFGLNSDRGELRRKFGLVLQGEMDLTQPLRKLGYRQRLGARAAIAVVFGQNLQKSKSVTTSNWAQRPLQTSQLLYAANDAFAALKIFHAIRTSAAPK